MSKQIEGYRGFRNQYELGEMNRRNSFIQVFSSTRKKDDIPTTTFRHEIPGLDAEKQNKIHEQFKKFMFLSRRCRLILPVERAYLKVDELDRQPDISNRCYFIVSPKTICLEDVQLQASEVVSCISRIVLSLKFLHDNGFVHKNISPSTILFDESKKSFLACPGIGYEYLIDLMDEEESIDPEVFVEEKFEKTSDVYSFGKVFKTLMTEKENGVISEYYQKEHSDLVKIIEDCCIEDPEKRPSLNDILNFLEKKEGTLSEDEFKRKYLNDVRVEEEEEEEEEGEEDDEDDEDDERKLSKRRRFRKKELEDKITTVGMVYESGTKTTTTRHSEKSKMISKLCIIGDSSVGKTSILHRYSDNKFSCSYKATIGADFRMKEVEVAPNKQIRFQIWDTAGQERFQSLGNAFYRGSDCGIIIFDLTSKDSFEHACNSWYPEFMERSATEEPENLVIVMVGNKCDLVTNRKVTSEEARRFCRQKGILYYECSAKSGENVDQLFREVSKYLAQAMEERKDKEVFIPSIRMSDRMMMNKARESGGACCDAGLPSLPSLEDGWSWLTGGNATTTKSEPAMIIPKRIPRQPIKFEEEGLKKKKMYKTLKIIGQGGQSSVYLVEKKDDLKLYTIKRYKQDLDQEYDLEVAALSTLPEHNNIVKFYDKFQYTDNYGEINKFIVMEYCEKGDLNKFIRRNRRKKFDLNKYLNFALQILSGLRKIHQEGFVHHDVKPANIFIGKDFSLKLGDFGFAMRCKKLNNQTGEGKDDDDNNDNVTNSSGGGTLKYMSEEQEKGAICEPNLDVFSVSLVLIELALKRLDANLRKNKDAKNLTLESLKELTHPLLKERIEDGLDVALKRPSCGELIECIKMVQKTLLI